MLWNLLKDGAITAKEKWTLMTEIDRVLGFKVSELELKEPEIPQSVETLLQRREAARKQKNFSLADKIRKELQEQGFSLEDTSDGPKIRRIT